MANYKVALDAGHGGSDPGAVYNGRQEKDDTLDLTLAVGDILKKNGVDVFYTRTTDEYETPFKKATDANNSGADLFISIHRNSSETPNQYSGVESLVFNDTGLKAEVARNINNQLEDVGFKNLGNDPGAGRGCSETFLLSVIVELIVSGSLHRRQERVFRELLRRRCEVFRDAGGHTFQSIALVDFGQGLHGIVLFLRLEGCLEQFLDGFPAVLNDGLALGFERIALAGKRDLRFCVGMLLAGRTQKSA